MAFVPSLLTGKGSYDQAAPLIALSAFGPQDEFLYDAESKFRPSIRQHTNFAQFHRVTKLPGTKFIGQTVTVEMDPKQFGDIFTNIYLALSLPPIVDAAWTDQVGRAIIEKIEFRIGDEIIEKVTDDWLILHDQLFLDAEEKLAMFKSINGGYIEGSDTPGTQQLDLFIPLEFFFVAAIVMLTKSLSDLRYLACPCVLSKTQKYLSNSFSDPKLGSPTMQPLSNSSTPGSSPRRSSSLLRRDCTTRPEISSWLYNGSKTSLYRSFRTVDRP